MSESNYISIKGAKVNNLKTSMSTYHAISWSLSRAYPVPEIIIGFDTLYAEGQRRYVESLSSYARQFLGRMSKPECDFIKGIPPAIAIEQK